MEYKEIKNRDGEKVYVSLYREEVRTDFATGMTQAELYYHSDVPRDDNASYEVRVELSGEFIDDTYHLKDAASIDIKVRACLDIGVRAYEEKQDKLREIERILGITSSSRLRYIPRIDMKSVDS
jgi:hypothetical protein